MFFALVKHFGADFAQVAEREEGERDVRVPVGRVDGVLLGQYWGHGKEKHEVGWLKDGVVELRLHQIFFDLQP